MQPLRPASTILVASLALAACGARESGAAALDELEALAFVPPGEASFTARAGPGIVCENPEALLVGRYETTRREVRAWIDTGPPDLDGRLAAEVDAWPEETLDWPASFLDRAEARAYCAGRGLRLPTAAEWLRIASGPRVQPWPWGATEIQSVANTLALRLDRPCPVGTFEQGQTPLGVYDLSGNVWEWVEAPIGAELPAESSAWCMGGSFASRLRRIYEIGQDGRLVFHAQELDPGSRSTDIGLRPVAVARDWFRAHAAALEGGADARERLVRIGARWGSEAAPALERLAREPGSPECVRHLLAGARS